MGLGSANRLIVRALLILLMLACGVIIETLQGYQRDYMRDSLQSGAREELSLIRYRLEASILADIYSANSLSTLVTLRPDSTPQEWDTLAGRVMREVNHVKVIGLAPNDVIRFVYPLANNQPALGLDYRTIPSQWSSIIKARQLKTIFIAGPVNLVQGGRSLIVRIPVFTDPPDNNKYWGVCSLVLDWESLLSESGISQLAQDYDIALRGADSSGANGALFYGQQSTFAHSFATETVRFPYGSWVIAAREKQDPLAKVETHQRNLIRLIGYPLMLVLTIAFVIIYRLYRSADIRAMHDEMTHLPNRRYFIFTLESFFEHAQKSESSDNFALLNIDLDKFKQINDTLGHGAGDKVLVECAQRMKAVLRGSDIVARVGGDEFLVLLPRINDFTDVQKVIQTIDDALCHAPVTYEGQAIDLQVSVGYALFDEGFPHPDAMLKQADERMYCVKRAHQPD